MTEIDSASLDRILPAAAGTADWDDVMSRFRLDRRRRRRRLVVLTAAAVVVFVGTASAFGTVRELLRNTEFLGKGLVGLPPVGAQPSTPEGGTLVARWGHVGGYLLYADGRLISSRDVDVPGRGGVDPLWSGWLEQRLTPKGVELVRSKILSSGGFEGDPRPPGSEAVDAPAVRLGDRWVELAWVRYAMKLQLTEPEAWLPASAWKDRAGRPYIPSRYAVCLPVDDVSRAVSSLPEAAQRRVRNRELRPAGFMPWSCATVATREARELSEILDAAGLKRHEPLMYELELPGGKGMQMIVFEPYFPHGEFPCSSCG